MPGAKVREGGTYLCMEGPQFSTRAESDLYRDWGCHVIGMTNMPEAKLAREAELPYASLAMVTDYDCWHDDHAHVQVDRRSRRGHARQRRPGQGHGGGAVQAVWPKTARTPSPIDTVPGLSPDHPARASRPGAAWPSSTRWRAAPSLSDCRYPRTDPRADAIRTIPDYPKPGIMFRDITTLLGDARAFRRAVDEMVQPFAGQKIDKVAGIEARGFILGAAVAHQLSAGFVPLRKKGKLPHKTLAVEYALEYGSDVLEMHHDAMRPRGAGDARGRPDRHRRHRRGRAQAAPRCGGRRGRRLPFVIDLPELGGAELLRRQGVPTSALVAFEGH